MYCLIADRGRGVTRMTLETLAKLPHVTGVKQVTKAVNKGKAVCVFVASDADGRVTQPLKALCGTAGVELVETATMSELGRACSIEVGSAAAAALAEKR